MPQSNNNILNTKEGFDDLFNAYYNKIVRFVYSIVKSEEIAVDITQDIFIKLWNSRDSIVIKGSVNSYMYAMAKNATLNYLRTQRTERLYLECQSAILSEFYSTEAQYDARDVLESIRKCIFAMPEPRKAIFILSRSNELTNAQVAEKLGMSVKNVEYHISKALSELREIIKK